MAVNLSIKGVPEDLASQLRARAERNHRSLQGELMAIVERAAAEVDVPAALRVDRLTGASSMPRPHQVDMRIGSKSIEQLAAEHRVLYPEPFQDLPLGVDIIREDRDSR